MLYLRLAAALYAVAHNGTAHQTKNGGRCTTATVTNGVAHGPASDGTQCCAGAAAALSHYLFDLAHLLWHGHLLHHRHTADHPCPVVLRMLANFLRWSP
jgi:hypothetical protein